MTENELKVVRDALEQACHALVTIHGAHATDRPDLVGQRRFADISWPIDEARALNTISEALGVLAGTARLLRPHYSGGSRTDGTGSVASATESRAGGSERQG